LTVPADAKTARGAVVAHRLIVDLRSDGLASVVSWRDGEPRASRAGRPFELVWPLDGEDLEELRWYLEDYLLAPFGVYAERGPEIADVLAMWGEAIFAAAFPPGPSRAAYLGARSGRPVATELVFRSSSPGLLALPWELIRDPSRRLPLALDLVGVTREVPAPALDGAAFAARGKRLRVLMVISRPRGGADIGYRMIARPLVERLEAIGGPVELVVLRPPTIEALELALAEALAQGEPFQVVHFDGHGEMAGRARSRVAGAVRTPGASVEGQLVFEHPDGGGQLVSAARVARVLKAGRVPLVVLNACQSGAIGKQLEAAVATRLLQEGAAAVVAMAYTLHAVAAAEFMTAFYERLFAGDLVSAAVTAGRRRLYAHDERPSPTGMVPLADWVVPVYYRRREVRLGGLNAAPTGDRPRELQAAGSFVGRDALFYELEVALRQRRVVLLHGLGGAGKTELAKAFGRWWRDTGGADAVIFHSFEPGVANVGLEGVVGAIGLRMLGADFARLGAEQQLAAVADLLQRRRLLLIWDNFESLHTMPDPTHGGAPLEVPRRAEMLAFLERVAATGRSSVVITSRTEETWLGDLPRLAVGGLTTNEATEYAQELLAHDEAADARRRHPAFAELLHWLDGHPLAMRLVLPQLADRDPEELLASLQGVAEAPVDRGGDASRTDSLAACVRYSFEHLPASSRTALVAVCLFQGVVDGDLLARFSRVPGAPERFAAVDAAAWSDALDVAATVGLLTRLGGGMYRVHPGLPGFVADQWRREDPDHYDRERAAAVWALLTAHAAIAEDIDGQIRRGDAAHTFAAFDNQRRAFTQRLVSLIETGDWEAAGAIAEPLVQYLDACGSYDDIPGLVDRVRLAVETPEGTLPALDSPAGALWLFLVGWQLGRQRAAGQLDAAERMCHEIVAMLQRQPPSALREWHLATSCRNLGSIAQERGLLDDAKDRFMESLAIAMDLGDRRGTADSWGSLGLVARLQGRPDQAEECYLNALTLEEELGYRRKFAATQARLGMIAESRGRLDVAEEWYAKSLTTHRELGDLCAVADIYGQLGTLADIRGLWKDAHDWYRLALTIQEDLGDPVGIAVSYHNLGIVAQRLERFADAEDWFAKSLVLAEDLGDLIGIASTYHQLGTVAHDRGRLDGAEGWYTKALAVNEELGNRAGIAATAHQLGRIAQDRGRLDDAEVWYTKALALNEDLGNRTGLAITYLELGILAQDRGRLDRATDCYIWSRAISEEVGDLPGTAMTSFHLGVVARDQARLDDAEAWYAKALAIEEELGDWPATAGTYHQRGLVARRRGRFDEAERWYTDSLTLFEELRDPTGVQANLEQLRLLAQERADRA
jgi:tetratricopeptide (TPR) repeat protein